MWCFNVKGDKFHYSTCPQEEELRVFLELSGCFDYLHDSPEPFHRPVIVTDQIGIMWVMEHYINAYGGAEFLVIIGPMFSSDRSVADIDLALKEMNLSLETKFRMFRIMERIPVVTRSIVKQYAIMLHYCLTQEGIQPGDLIYREFRDEVHRNREEESEGKRNDEADVMRIAQYEELLLKAIREGNEDYAAIEEETSRINGGSFIINSGDFIRDARLSVAILCALSSRAAIQGGAVIYTAKKVEKSYLDAISKCRSVDRLIKLRNDMLGEFVDLVKKAKSAEEMSREIRSCCDYIHANVTSALTFESLAKRYGYTVYYFTKKFYKEVGVRLGEYIKDARIAYAKILLLTTTKSIDDISFDLQFSNRNYFSKVFNEKVGMTPATFRARAGVLSGTDQRGSK